MSDELTQEERQRIEQQRIVEELVLARERHEEFLKQDKAARWDIDGSVRDRTPEEARIYNDKTSEYYAALGDAVKVNPEALTPAEREAIGNRQAEPDQDRSRDRYRDFTMPVDSQSVVQFRSEMAGFMEERQRQVDEEFRERQRQVLADLQKERNEKLRSEQANAYKVVFEALQKESDPEKQALGFRVANEEMVKTSFEMGGEQEIQKTHYREMLEQSNLQFDEKDQARKSISRATGNTGWDETDRNLFDRVQGGFKGGDIPLVKTAEGEYYRPTNALNANAGGDIEEIRSGSRLEALEFDKTVPIAYQLLGNLNSMNDMQSDIEKNKAALAETGFGQAILAVSNDPDWSSRQKMEYIQQACTNQVQAASEYRLMEREIKNQPLLGISPVVEQVLETGDVGPNSPASNKISLAAGWAAVASAFSEFPDKLKDFCYSTLETLGIVREREEYSTRSAVDRLFETDPAVKEANESFASRQIATAICDAHEKGRRFTELLEPGVFKFADVNGNPLPEDQHPHAFMNTLRDIAGDHGEDNSSEGRKARLEILNICTDCKTLHKLYDLNQAVSERIDLNNATRNELGLDASEPISDMLRHLPVKSDAQFAREFAGLADKPDQQLTMLRERLLGDAIGVQCAFSAVVENDHDKGLERVNRIAKSSLEPSTLKALEDVGGDLNKILNSAKEAPALSNEDTKPKSTAASRRIQKQKASEDEYAFE